MRGVNYITDENNLKKAVIIDLKLLDQSGKKVYELLDGIVAEFREHEEKKSLDNVIKGLKKVGKIK